VNLYIVTSKTRFSDEPTEHYQVFKDIKRATVYYKNMRKSDSLSVQFYVIEKELNYSEILLLSKLEDV